MTWGVVCGCRLAFQAAFYRILTTRPTACAVRESNPRLGHPLPLRIAVRGLVEGGGSTLYRRQSGRSTSRCGAGPSPGWDGDRKRAARGATSTRAEARRMATTTSARAGAVLLLDNYDSYTWNVANLIAEVLGRPPLVVYNDGIVVIALVEALPPLRIVLSPGPGSAARAADFGLCAAALASGLPVLGVPRSPGLCLAFGGEVGRAASPCTAGRVRPRRHRPRRRRRPSWWVRRPLVAHTVPSCLRSRRGARRAR